MFAEAINDSVYVLVSKELALGHIQNAKKIAVSIEIEGVVVSLCWGLMFHFYGYDIVGLFTSYEIIKVLC